MSVSPLLAIAAGALKGANANRAAKRQREEQDLETALRLQSMPGVTLEDPNTQPTRDALSAAAAVMPSIGAGAGIMVPPIPVPAQAPGRIAGELTIGGKRQAVRLDPTQTPEGRRAAQDQANRASLARLQKLDPTLWGQQYDPNYDYGGAERDETKKASTEQQLIAAGYDPKRAKIYARTGFDVDKRDQELTTSKARLKLEERRTAAAEQSAAATAANATTTSEEKKAKAIESEAINTALSWAMEGKRQKIDDSTLQQQIADALPAMYPALTAAQRAGVAAQAILKREESRARIGARDRSGIRVPGAKLPAGVTVPAGAGAAAAPVKSTAAKVDPARARKKAIEELVDAGKNAEEIKAELKRRGLL